MDALDWRWLAMMPVIAQARLRRGTPRSPLLQREGVDRGAVPPWRPGAKLQSESSQRARPRCASPAGPRETRGRVGSKPGEGPAPGLLTTSPFILASSSKAQHRLAVRTCRPQPRRSKSMVALRLGISSHSRSGGSRRVHARAWRAPPVDTARPSHGGEVSSGPLAHSAETPSARGTSGRRPGHPCLRHPFVPRAGRIWSQEKRRQGPQPELNPASGLTCR